MGNKTFSVVTKAPCNCPIKPLAATHSHGSLVRFYPSLAMTGSL